MLNAKVSYVEFGLFIAIIECSYREIHSHTYYVVSMTKRVCVCVWCWLVKFRDDIFAIPGVVFLCKTIANIDLRLMR